MVYDGEVNLRIYARVQLTVMSTDDIEIIAKCKTDWEQNREHWKYALENPGV